MVQNLRRGNKNYTKERQAEIDITKERLERWEKEIQEPLKLDSVEKKSTKYSQSDIDTANLKFKRALKELKEEFGEDPDAVDLLVKDTTTGEYIKGWDPVKQQMDWSKSDVSQIKEKADVYLKSLDVSVH